MKTFFVIVVSSIALTIIGTIIYGSYNAEKARQYRNQILVSRHSAYTPNEYWPDRSDVKKVVTYPKAKVAKAVPSPTPQPAIPAPTPTQIIMVDMLNPSPTPYKRVVNQREYRKDVAVIHQEGKEPIITTWFKDGKPVVVDNPKDYYAMLNSN